MEAMHWRLYRYTLPLATSLALPTGTVDERGGMLVSVTDDEGRVGWGEIAPLPGFSRVPLEEACAAAQRAVAARGMASIPDSASDFTHPFPGATFGPTVPASVRFGVDMALADLTAQRWGTHVAGLLAQEYQRSLPLNALLMGAPDAVMRGAEDTRKRGFAVAKLKVGRQPVEDDIRLVQAARKRLGPDVRLRLDANRAWSLDEGRAFAEGIDPRWIEYVEEPVADLSDLNDFVAASGLPVALDETVQERAPEDLEPFKVASAIIVKPTLIGGIGSQRYWVEAAQRQSMATVYSAAFESGVGTRHLIALASALGTPDVPVGFDTYRWLGDDLIEPRLDLGRPHLDVDAMLSLPRRPRMEHLERV